MSEAAYGASEADEEFPARRTRRRIPKSRSVSYLVRGEIALLRSTIATKLDPDGRRQALTYLGKLEDVLERRTPPTSG